MLWTAKVEYRTWATRTGRSGLTTTSTLFPLPPTTEVFTENVKRSHLKTCIWKSALDQDPPKLDFAQYDWEKALSTKSML